MASLYIIDEKTGNYIDLADVAPVDNADIKRAVIRCNTNGNNTIIAAVTGKSIKVISVLLVAAGAVNVRFESGASGTALTGVMTLTAGGDNFVLPPAAPGYHWFETADAELLNLELSAGVFVNGCIVYYEE